MAGELFQQSLGAYAPIASGYDHIPQLGFEGIPGFGGGGLLSLGAQFLLAPTLQRMMGGVGMMPMGLGHDQNVGDILENRRFTLLYRQAMRRAAAEERANYMRTFRGLAAMTGTPFGAQQREAAGALADAATTMAPIMAEIAPDFMDALSGMRGSPTVMAHRMALAGRYRLDPVTGQMRMSQESTDALSRQTYRDLFERGDLASMRGFSAGQVGGLFDELTRRGMVDAPTGSLRSRTRTAVEELQALDPRRLQQAADNVGVRLPRDAAVISPDDLDKLRLDPAVADRLRNFDAERIKRSIKSYVGAVSAVRDIFGDIGRPNAPMSELVAGLEAMTQGSLSQVDPTRLGMMVRQTYELSKLTGVGLDSAMAIQQHAAARAEQLHMEPIFGVQAAQGTLAWSGAFRATGGAATPAWGRMNADQQAQLDANLRVQASDSRLANQMAVVMRIGERAGGFAEGTTAAAYAAAVRSGQTEFLDPATGRVRSVAMAQGDFTSMLTGAAGRNGLGLGITQDTVTEMLGQRDTNREQVERFGIGNTVRAGQGRIEVRPWLAARLAENLTSHLRGQGISEANARDAAQRASRRVIDRMMDMGQGDFASATRRTELIGRALQEELEGTEAGRQVAAGGVDQDAFYRLGAERFFGYANTMIRRGPFRGLRNMQQVFTQFNEQTMQASEQLTLQSAFAAQVKDAMTPLGRGSVIRRAVQALQDIRPGDPAAVERVIAQTFGGVSTDAMKDKLQRPIADLHTKLDAIKGIQEQAAAAPAGEARSQLLAKLDTQMQALRAQISTIAETATEFGFGGDEGVTRDQALRGLDSMRQMLEGIQDLRGLRGGFGHEVTQKEADELVGTGFKDREEARAAIGVRREAELRNITPEQIAAVRKANPQLISDAAAQRFIREDFQARLGAVSDKEADELLQGGKIDNADEARAVLLSRRARMPIRPDDAMIADLRKADPKLSEAEARDLGTQRLRAARLGITPEDLQKARNEGLARIEEEIDRIKDDPANAPRVAELEARRKRGIDEATAIDLAFDVRARQQFQVSGEEIGEYLKRNPQLAGDREKARTGILGKRFADQKARFGQFWHSASGGVFRESVDEAAGGLETVATGAVMSPASLRRFGPQAIAQYERQRKLSQESRDLALYYSRGDMARLAAGELDIDWRTEAGQAELTRVQDRIRTIQRQQTEVADWFAKRMTGDGRQWGDDDRDTARRLLGFTPGQKLTAAQQKELDRAIADVGVAKRLSDKDLGQVEAFRGGDKQFRKAAADRGTDADTLAAVLTTGALPRGAVRLSDADRRSVDAAGRRYDENLTKERQAREQLQELLDSTKGRDLTADEQKQLHALREARQKASREASLAQGAVARIAVGAGVTPLELFHGRGEKALTPFSEAETSQIDAGRAAYTKARDERDRIHHELNLAKDRLERAQPAPDAATRKDLEKELAALRGQKPTDATRDRIAEIQRQLRHGTVTLTADERKELQARTGTLEVNLARQELAVAGALGDLDTVGAPRGVTGRDLLLDRRKGHLPAEEADRLRALLTAQKGRGDEVDALVARLKKDGAPIKSKDDLLHAADTIRKVDDLAKRYQEEEQLPAPKLVGRLFETFGFTADEEQADALAGRFATTRGDRANVRHLIESQQFLQQVVGRRRQALDQKSKVGAAEERKAALREADEYRATEGDKTRGVASLAKRYSEATAGGLSAEERRSRLDVFRRDFGLTDDEEFSRFESELRFQKTTGALGIADSSRSGGTAEARRKQIDRLLEDVQRGGPELGGREPVGGLPRSQLDGVNRGGELKPPPGPAGAPGSGAQQIEISGDLTLHGDQVHISAVSTGIRDVVAVTG